MKRLIFILIVTLCCSAVKAQNEDKKWAVGFGSGYAPNLSVNDHDLRVEAYLSRYISPSIDLRLMQANGVFISKPDTANLLDNYNFLLELRYKFNNGRLLPVSSKLQPYLYAGGGYFLDNNYKGFNFDGGVGVKYVFSNTVALYAGVGYVYGIDTWLEGVKRHDNFLNGVIGLEFSLGKAFDSDGDGVPDKRDHCPGTEKGFRVDRFGCLVDSDGDGIIDMLDKCPKEKGPIEFQGCPDTDKDGIPDPDDDCPKVYGSVMLKGCPDTDNDGVSDNEDLCPDVAGTIKSKGCPDRDGDGVADADDICPDSPGTISTKGCPDVDLDGIPDSEDECPDFAGPKSFNGCPDSDNDGVSDKYDKCFDTPEKAKVDSNGCPLDSDNDGVFDGIDKCPKIKGLIINNGCPLDANNVEWLNDMNVNPIFFEKESSEITRESRQRMADLIGLLLEDSGYNVNVSGMAGRSNNSEAARQLLSRRVNAVVDYLISKGVVQGRISTENVAKLFPGKAIEASDEMPDTDRIDFKLFK